MTPPVSLIWRAALSVAAVILLAPGPVKAQGFKWWQNEGVQRKLALTADQSKRIEDVFQAALPELRRVKHQLDTLEAELARLMETPADDATVAQQVDRVEAVRAGLNKARTLMLLRIRRILNAEQRVRLEELHKERERDHADRDQHH